MKRTVTGRWLFLAVAILALSSQVAAAAHIPALHEAEDTSKCKDPSEHFCAETAPDEGGRCVLCQVSLGGITWIQVSHSESIDVAEPVAVPDCTAPRSVL